MRDFSRRQFIQSTLGGAGFALGAGLAPLGSGDSFAADKPEKPETKPDTLFLTWQRDPTTTMTVQWVGKEKEPAQAAISFTPLGKDKWQTVATADRAYPLSELRAFRAELTGLSPGTEYEFRVGDHKVPFRFRTMPAKATDSFSFISGGDCGVNPHTVANNQIAAKQDPMFAIVGGDLAYDDGKKIDTNLQFMRNYHDNMVDSEGRLIPMVVCIGNHEVNGGYNKPRVDAPFFFALYDGLFSEHSYATLDFGDYLSLVLLDTAHVSPIEGEQTDWLDKALRPRKDHPHLFVVNHVPAYPSFRPMEGETNGKSGTGEGNRKHWVPLFEKHNVDLVLEHHDHTFKRTHPLKDGHVDPNGIVYLGDGSWGKLRAPKKPEDRPYLAATHETYHLTLHRLEGDQAFHMAIEETGKIMDICSTQKKPRGNVG